MPEVDLRRALPRHLTWILGLVSVWFTIGNAAASRWGRDSHAYWAAWQHDGLYANAPGTVDAYNYSPAFAQLVWPLAHLPWPVFGLAFGVAATIAFVHLFRPLGWAWTVPLVLCCAPEIVSGNVFWVLALVAAYGLRRPGVWAFALLTKVTPGLGPLWFALRREWRPFAVSLVVTLAVAGASAVVMPGAWHAWYEFMTSHAGATSARTGSDYFPPMLVRLPFAVVLLVWAALTERRWGLPAAMVLATPVSGIAAFTILAALPRLSQRRPDENLAAWNPSSQPATTRC